MEQAWHISWRYRHFRRLMKSCPICHQTFENDSLKFCRQDGTALVVGADSSIHSEPAINWSDVLVDTLSDLQAEPPGHDKIEVPASVAADGPQESSVEFEATLKLD